jgi:Annexin
VLLFRAVASSLRIWFMTDVVFAQANKKKTIDALATQDATTRYYMSIRYKELYNESLEQLMKKEFSGDVGLALRWLAMPADQAEAKMIKEACKGVGSEVNMIWSILVGRTPDEIARLKKAFFDMYSKDLGKLLGHELSGDMERLVFTCLQGTEEAYDPHFHTKEKALEDAELIHTMGQGRWGTNERGLFKIVCISPKQHVENISAYVVVS